jgi:putative acetyltransferase
MRVRPARPEDVPALARVAARSYGHAFRAILDAAALESRDSAYFAALFAEKRSGMQVAESEGKAVGFSLVTDGHIDMLFIDPAEAGRGGGTMLLRAAEAAGARTLEAFRDNGPARAFYESRGWRAVEEYEREFAGALRAFVLYRPAAQEGSE